MLVLLDVYGTSDDPRWWPPTHPFRAERFWSSNSADDAFARDVRSVRGRR